MKEQELTPTQKIDLSIKAKHWLETSPIAKIPASEILFQTTPAEKEKELQSFWEAKASALEKEDGWT